MSHDDEEELDLIETIEELIALYASETSPGFVADYLAAIVEELRGLQPVAN